MKKKKELLNTAVPFSFVGYYDYQQKNKYSCKAAAGIDKDIKYAARSFGYEILMDLIACGIENTGNKRNVYFSFAECKMYCSAQAEAERRVFREMCDFSQNIMGNDVAEILDNQFKKILAQLLGFIAVIARKQENNYHHGNAQNPENNRADSTPFIHQT